MKEHTIKAVIVAAFAAFSVYLQIIIVPFVVLLAVVIIDYLTGIGKAWTSGTLSSKAGFIGIIKKLSYAVLIIVGAAVDYLLSILLTHLGLDINYTICIGLILIIWLIINELISILENLAILGVPIPSFLKKIIKKLKVTVDEVAELPLNEND